MNNFKHFNFRNFVAVNVTDDFFFVDAMGFWERARILELQQAHLNGSPMMNEYEFPLSVSAFEKLTYAIKPYVFEKSLAALLPLMEEGLIVIGEGRSGVKTSYGYYALKQPEGTIYDAIAAARDDFLKDYASRHLNFEWSWMVQATTEGWKWANHISSMLPTKEYLAEKEEFFRSGLSGRSGKM